MRLFCLCLLVVIVVSVSAQTILNDTQFEFTSFENTRWGADTSLWSLDNTIAHSGSTSLKYMNSDPSISKACTQRFPVKPGYAYRISAWIQTNGVQGPDPIGASLALEWRDSKGNYVGGFYPNGFKGTTPWQRFEAVSMAAPSDAAYAIFVAYVRAKSTGVVWFDDVSVEETMPRLWKVFVLSPSYRGQFTTQTEKVQLSIELFPGLNPSEYSINANAQGVSSGRTFGTDIPATAKKTLCEIILPKDLPPDTYKMTVKLLDKTRQEKASFQTTLTKLSSINPTTVRFEKGLMYVNNKLFVPIGIYDQFGWQPGETEQRLKLIADAGFNSVVCYGLIYKGMDKIQSYLDEAKKNNLMVIASIKDCYEGSPLQFRRLGDWNTPETIVKGVVSAFRNHPALLAWYVNDELGMEFQQKLERNYNWVTELDPNHPCFTISNQPDALDLFVNSTDVLGTDPSPVPGLPLTVVADWTKAAVATGKPVWIAVQTQDKSLYLPSLKSQPPTFEEKRCMAYMALVSGAKGLLFYSFNDLKRTGNFDREWGHMKRIVKELRQFDILNATSTPVSMIIQGIPSKVYSTAFTDKTCLYTVVVNPSDKPCQITMALPPEWQTTGKDLITCAPIAFDGKQRLPELAPYEARVLVFPKKPDSK